MKPLPVEMAICVPCTTCWRLKPGDVAFAMLWPVVASPICAALIPDSPALRIPIATGFSSNGVRAYPTRLWRRVLPCSIRLSLSAYAHRIGGIACLLQPVGKGLRSLPPSITAA